MKNRVLDSWAILESISGRQPGTDIVGKLKKGEAGCCSCLRGFTPFSESSRARRSLSTGASLPDSSGDRGGGHCRRHLESC